MWELLPFLQVIVYNYYRCHRQGSRAASSSSQQQLLYSQQSNTTAYFTCSCAFAQRKTKKENEKSGEKTITEDACVSLWYLSYSHLIVQHKQQKNISLFNSYSFPSVYSCALPSRLLKMRPNQKIYIAMGRIDGWMSCIWLQIWCKTTRSPYCVFRY